MITLSNKWDLISQDRHEDLDISYFTYRMEVHGGWLVNNTSQYFGLNKDYKRIIKHSTESMTFVSDPSHEWEA
jgi:hypothetical protein